MTDKQTELIQLAVQTYNFHGQLGVTPHALPHAVGTLDVSHPDVWSANKVSSLRASTASQFETMLVAIDALYAGLSYRHVVLDPFTPELCVARLAMLDYEQTTAFVQMVLQGDLQLNQAVPDNLEFEPVCTEQAWQTLLSLVLADHAEGGRTQAGLAEATSRGIVADYQRKVSHCTFYIATRAGVPCGYGSATCPSLQEVGPNMGMAMGMVEDLFTLPQFRRQGIASAVIQHCVDQCRSQGAGPVLIGSHSNEQPKHLYQQLGFEPVCLTRNWMRFNC